MGGEHKADRDEVVLDAVAAAGFGGAMATLAVVGAGPTGFAINYAQVHCYGTRGARICVLIFAKSFLEFRDRIKSSAAAGMSIRISVKTSNLPLLTRTSPIARGINNPCRWITELMTETGRESSAPTSGSIENLVFNALATVFSAARTAASRVTIGSAPVS